MGAGALLLSFCLRKLAINKLFRQGLRARKCRKKRCFPCTYTVIWDSHITLSGLLLVLIKVDKKLFKKREQPLSVFNKACFDRTSVIISCDSLTVVVCISVIDPISEFL